MKNYKRTDINKDLWINDYGNNTFIGKTQRAFTSDPDLLITHAKIFIDSHRKRHIVSCGKHFPGQGSAFGDTHEGYTDISDNPSKFLWKYDWSFPHEFKPHLSKAFFIYCFFHFE